MEDKIFLCIKLTQRPRVSQINYSGVKKGEREDLENRIGLLKDNQLTPNMIDRAKFLIKKYFDEKGYKNAEIEILQRDDVAAPDKTIVDIRIDKKEKVKIHSITIEGNHALSTKKIKGTMFVPGVFKKTNEKGRPGSWFRTKKFIEEKYKEDKENLIKKYNELGYRDAVILEDSVVPHNEKTVDVYVKVEEGQRYYLRNIEWVGNTIYPTTTLNNLLRMKKGDVYNQTKLEERTSTDEDAVGNLYYNNGYVFYRLDPVEVNIDGDSIDLELRIFEGPQATIRHIAVVTTVCTRAWFAVSCVPNPVTCSARRLWNVPIVKSLRWGISTRNRLTRRSFLRSRTVRWTSIGDWCRSRTTR